MILVFTLLSLLLSSPANAVEAIDLHLTDEGVWRAVDDRVMGGVSQSRLRVDDAGVMVFEGELSLERGGGFASVRRPMELPDLRGYEGIALRVRGDGRRYRLRLRTDERFDGIAYQGSFSTTEGEWQVVRLPFALFEASFRGRAVPGAAPLDPAGIRQIGLMVADRQRGRFRLEVERAWAYPPGEPPSRPAAEGTRGGDGAP